MSTSGVFITVVFHRCSHVRVSFVLVFRYQCSGACDNFTKVSGYFFENLTIVIIFRYGKYCTALSATMHVLLLFPKVL